MIKKERKLPIILQQYEALLRRLPSNHERRGAIEGEIAKSRAGYRGEQSIDYYLTFFPQEEFFILHDIRLPLENEKFVQIDTLILTNGFLIILEVKNISGTLMFDQALHQLIRTKDGEEEAFPDPILQIKRQQRFIAIWLEKHRFPLIPIESFIVISNSSTIIKTDPPNREIFHKVIHADFIPEKIEQVKKKFHNAVLTNKQLKKLSQTLTRQHTPLYRDVLSFFQIDEKDILTGVQCPACLSLPMLRKYGTWYCNYCDSFNKNAHVQAIEDYCLIFKSTITNGECRKFLHLPSRYTTVKLLRTLSSSYSGSYRNRTYTLPKNRE